MPDSPMKALLAADRAAATNAHRRAGGLGPYTLVHGAPSHTFAYLLSALNELGWTVAPMAVTDDMVDRAAKVIAGRLGFVTVGPNTRRVACLALDAALNPKEDR